MEHYVINASPLICLGKAGYLNLLLQLSNQTVVPQAVEQEIAAGPAGDSAKRFLESSSLSVVEVTVLQEILAWDLGKGETSVLSYALVNTGWTAIIDDLAARKCARSYAIPLRGTLAIIILAKKKSLIPSAKEGMLALQSAGLRLDDEVIRIALKRELGEDW